MDRQQEQKAKVEGWMEGEMEEGYAIGVCNPMGWNEQWTMDVSVMDARG